MMCRLRASAAVSPWERWNVGTVGLFRHSKSTGVMQPFGAHRHFIRSGSLKLITKNSRTVGGPYHQWGPRHLTQQPPHRYATEQVVGKQVISTSSVVGLFMTPIRQWKRLDRVTVECTCLLHIVSL